MRQAVIVVVGVLVGWWITPSLTPQVPVPSGLGWSAAWQQGDDMAANGVALMPGVPWHNWIYDHLDNPNYLPTAYSLRTSYQQQYIDAAVTHNARLWRIGSEPNLPETAVSPSEAAQSVQRWAAEYMGPIACCGVVLWDGYGWREWMTAYLAAGGVKTPYCDVHVFDSNGFVPVRAYRQWLTEHGWECEIIVSEVANPWGTVADNMSLMDDMAQMVANGEIRAAAWYSLNDWHDIWHVTDLTNADATELTPLGSHLLSLQPGGVNDPRATATPEPTALDEDAQPRRVWLPWMKQ